MKKVLYIVTVPNIGGVNKYLIEFAKNTKHEYIPYFIMTNKGYLSEELEKLGYKQNIFYTSITNKVYDIKTLINSINTINNIIRNIKPDIIHCNTMPGGVVGRICGLITKTSVVYVPHSWAFTPGGRNKCFIILYAIIEMVLSIITDNIICVSEYEKKLALRIMPFFKSKFVTIHNGISDISEKYKKTDFSKSELNIVMISRFCPQKDPYTLISAVHDLNRDGYNVKLDLYGYGPDLEKVLESIKNQNDKKIQYKGEISDVTPILKNYDVYALISNWESLPIGIIEAMRSGLPLLVSNVGGNSECVKNNGYLVERSDISNCKEQIKKLYELGDKKIVLGQNSRSLYEKEFSVGKMINETLKIYSKLKRKENESI